jgi:hypothetical protein
MRMRIMNHSHTDHPFLGPRMSTASFPNDPASLVSPYGAQCAQSTSKLAETPRSCTWHQIQVHKS